MNPLLSIVIANYNYGRFISEAIQSVINQDMGNDVELIICDGGSTDNSVAVIKEYSKGLPPNTRYEEWVDACGDTKLKGSTQIIKWWCSERDGGQSAAFNKGFSHARGRFLTWLNADDIVLPQALKKFKLAVERFPECEWFVGGCLWLDPQMRIISCGRGRGFSQIRFECGQLNVCGPSSFMSSRVFHAVHGVDERFYYMMDTDLWIRIALNTKIRFTVFKDYVWGLRLHPDAKMSGHNFDPNGEFRRGTAIQLVPNSKKTGQLEVERSMINEYFKAKQMSFWKRLASVAWMQVLGSRIDTFRFKGKHYSEVFRQ